MFGRMLGADQRWNAELARDDRSMAGAAAAVGDDRGCGLHHRLPVRCGDVSNQNAARLEAAELPRILDDVDLTAADLGADRTPLRQDIARLLERIGLENQR